MAEWTGPTCLMCNGTGKDFRYVTEAEEGTPFLRVIKTVEIERPCRACNGHGRDAD